MVPPVDIFKIDQSGKVRWLESALDIGTAKARLKVLGIDMPGKYVVVSQQMGHKLYFDVDETGLREVPF